MEISALNQEIRGCDSGHRPLIVPRTSVKPAPGHGGHPAATSTGPHGDRTNTCGGRGKAGPQRRKLWTLPDCSLEVRGLLSSAEAPVPDLGHQQAGTEQAPSQWEEAGPAPSRVTCRHCLPRGGDESSCGETSVGQVTRSGICQQTCGSHVLQILGSVPPQPSSKTLAASHPC